MFTYLSFPAAPRIPRRVSVSLAGILTGLAFTALPAAVPVASAAAATCSGGSLSQPFLKWGDSNPYSLVSGEDFEQASTGWLLSRGAQRATGSESYAATGSLGGWSLSLSAGATAQSPFMCVGATERTFRLFSRGEGLAPTIVPQVVYQTPFGNIAVPVGLIASKKGWEPTAILKTGAPLATAIANGTVELALRFTAVSGTSRIDNILLDPRMRR